MSEDKDTPLDPGAESVANGGKAGSGQKTGRVKQDESKPEPNAGQNADAQSDKGSDGTPLGKAAKATAKSPPLLSEKVSSGKALTEEELGKKAPDGRSPDAKAASLQPKKSGRGLVILCWLAFLLAACGMGAAGYTYWSFERYQEANRNSVRATEARISQLVETSTGHIGANVQDVISRSNGQANQIDRHAELIDELQDRIAMTRRHIGQITQVSRQSWMLAEAEYLLRLANQRLRLENETAGSLAILSAADDILRQVDDINLLPVRSAVAQEVEALRAVAHVDVEGVFLRLQALANRVQTLALLLPASANSAPGQHEQGEDAENQSGFSLGGMFSSLNDVLRIRHTDQPVQPILSPQQHYYVQQNMRLMLEQAQLALLQKKQPLYEQSLAKAERWLADYFQLNESSSGLLASLAELKAINVAPELPDISGSLARLKDYLSSSDPAVTSTEAEAGEDRPGSMPRAEEGR